MLQRVLFGPVPHHDSHGPPITDLTTREWAIIVPLAVMCLALGVYPQPVVRAFSRTLPSSLVSQTAGPCRNRTNCKGWFAGSVAVQTAQFQGGMPRAMQPTSLLRRRLLNWRRRIVAPLGPAFDIVALPCRPSILGERHHRRSAARLAVVTVGRLGRDATFFEEPRQFVSSFEPLAVFIDQIAPF